MDSQQTGGVVSWGKQHRHRVKVMHEADSMVDVMVD